MSKQFSNSATQSLPAEPIAQWRHATRRERLSIDSAATQDSPQSPQLSTRAVALIGGEAGARLAAGLQAELAPGALTVVAPTSDDFEHWGVHVSPQLDTAMFYLAAASGWGCAEGRRAESFNTLQAMGHLGGEDWLALSDRELAVALRRTQWRREGLPATEISERLRRSMGVPSVLLPATDGPMQTLLHTDEGDLPHAHYALRRQHEPFVFDLSFLGAEGAAPSPSVLDALAEADLVLICVDNPYLWLDPLLALPELRRLLIRHSAPVLFVSPVETGKDFDTPLGKLMRELGHYISPLTFADRYAAIVDGCTIALADDVIREALAMPTLATDLSTHTFAHARRLARALLHYGARLQEPPILEAPAAQIRARQLS